MHIGVQAASPAYRPAALDVLLPDDPNRAAHSPHRVYCLLRSIVVDFIELEAKTLTELRDLARSMDLSGTSRLKKEDLILRLLRAKAEQKGYIFGGGVLDIVEDGIGFLRSDHYLPGPEDVYVSQSQIRRFGLRTGDMVVGQVRPPKDSEKYFGLLRVEAVNG